MPNKHERNSVLYVEASDLIQAWVIPLLENLNCSVKPAATAETARQYLKSGQPLDLVLLGDVTRPSEMTTEDPTAELSIIKQIRERKRYRHTKILIFTSHNYLRQAYKFGANAHIVKPIGANALTNFILPHLQD